MYINQFTRWARM